jgi:hypothetical protein
VKIGQRYHQRDGLLTALSVDVETGRILVVEDVADLDIEQLTTSPTRLKLEDD